MTAADVSVSVPLPWRSDKPRLTRDEAAATRFPVTTWTRRGYDPAAVDAFTARVVAELEMLATEKAGVWAALAELRGRFKRGENPGEWPADAAQALEAAVSVRSEAQLAADQAMADAQELAARVTADARSRWDAIVAEAQERLADAERVRRDAEEYAARVRAEADERARDAASIALDAPVGPDAERLVRAERARSASLGGGVDVYVENTLILAQTMARLLEDCRARIAENRQETPGPR